MTIQDRNGKTVLCPACKSPDVARDWPNTFLFLVGWCLPPASWLLFRLNRNAWCSRCGVRFRRDATGSFGAPAA